MIRCADTPTREPYEVALSREQRASIEVRKAAAAAHYEGVPLELALAEVRWAYERTS